MNQSDQHVCWLCKHRFVWTFALHAPAESLPCCSGGSGEPASGQGDAAPAAQSKPESTYQEVKGAEELPHSMGGELLPRRQWIVSAAARFADLNDTVDHELTLVYGGAQRDLLLDVRQRDAEKLLLFLSRARWENDEAGVYGLSVAELAEIAKVVRHEGPVLVYAVSQDLGVRAAEK